MINPRFMCRNHLLGEHYEIHKLYGKSEIFERHRHRWEINPSYWNALKKAGAVYPGWSKEKKLKEVFTLTEHFFYLGVQFHPEFKSRPWAPSPPYYGFVKASYDKKLGNPSPKF